ncbi:MAG: hypothetical protein KVP17_001328 [Porospora cf. gigantea B]|uniref:uncharacterized protein n=1 Tax=Porospora cf. gigantea B TaxID=2853592 RepID=UPI00357186D0|nr:MAG: hypothetical protein KVP17_001328 [Porospora cf. gigantea B]
MRPAPAIPTPMPSAPGIGEKLFDAIGGFDVSEPRLLSAFKDMSRLTSATSAGPGGSRMDLSEEPHMSDAHFIELSLKATLAGSGRNSLVVGLLEHLMGLSSVNIFGTFKEECWRVRHEDAGTVFTKTGIPAVKEMWLRRYVAPECLSNKCALRIYQQDLAHQQFPTRARRVKETVVSSGFGLILTALGFQQSASHDFYCRGQIFHHRPGTSQHVAVHTLRYFSDCEMKQELFPGKIYVEAKMRVDKDENLEAAAQYLLEFSGKLRP